MRKSWREADVASDPLDPHGALLYRRFREHAPHVQVSLPKQPGPFQRVGGGSPIDGPHSAPDGTKVYSVAMHRRSCTDVAADTSLIEQAQTPRFCPHHVQTAVLRGDDHPI